MSPIRTADSRSLSRDCRSLKSGGAVVMIHGRKRLAAKHPRSRAVAGPTRLRVPRAVRPPTRRGIRSVSSRRWRQNEPYLSSALRRVDELVADVVTSGIDRARIVHSRILARRVSRRGVRVPTPVEIRRRSSLFSGGLIGPPGTTLGRATVISRARRCSSGAATSTPTSPKRGSTRAPTRSSRMGAAVTERIYPGMGHLISDDEILSRSAPSWTDDSPLWDALCTVEPQPVVGVTHPGASHTPDLSESAKNPLVSTWRWRGCCRASVRAMVPSSMERSSSVSRRPSSVLDDAPPDSSTRHGRRVVAVPIAALARSPSPRDLAACPTRRSAAAHRRDGPGDGRLRRQRSARVHDFQGTAHRGAARSGIAEPREGDALRSRISGSTTTTGSTGPDWSGGCSRTSVMAARRRAAAPSRSSSRRQLSHAGQDASPKSSGADSGADASRACTRSSEILELYLNKVYFGDGLYGVEAASRGYFGKPARDLSIAEAAAAGRSGEVALDLCADRQHRSRGRAPQRRAAGRCTRPVRLTTPNGRPRKSAPVVLHDALRAEEPIGLVLQGAGPPGARRSIWVGTRLPGRSPRLFDDRHGACSERPKRPSPTG